MLYFRCNYSQAVCCTDLTFYDQKIIWLQFAPILLIASSEPLAQCTDLFHPHPSSFLDFSQHWWGSFIH